MNASRQGTENGVRKEIKGHTYIYIRLLLDEPE
jgi:hypothetical protein